MSSGMYLGLDPLDPRPHLVCRECGHWWGGHTWKSQCLVRVGNGWCNCPITKARTKAFVRPGGTR